MAEVASSFDSGRRGFGAGLLDAARDEVAADYRPAAASRVEDSAAVPALRRAARVVLALLLLAAMVSAAGVIHLRHQHRLSYLALHAAEAERDRLNIEWSQLLLERATHSGQPIVEEQARRRLGMSVPAPDSTFIIQLPAPQHGRER
jgi:cell division protein FtsL